MDSIRPLHLVRAASLVALLVMAIHLQLATALPPGTTGSGALLQRGTTLFFSLLFAACFWVNTRRMAGARLEPSRLGLLLIQVALVFPLNTDVFYLTAVESALVLPLRTAVVWMVGQAVFFAARALTFVGSEQFNPLGGLERAPMAAVVALSILSTIGWQLFAFSIGLLAASEHRARTDLARANAERLAAEQLLRESARDGERLRIARELHDSVGHLLAALRVQIELARRRSEGPPEILDRLQGIAAEVLRQVRVVVHRLREEPDSNLALALRTVAAGVYEPRIVLSIEEEAQVSDPGAAHALYRAAQEGVTNAIRHGGAGTVRISLARAGDEVVLEVSDDGRGANGIEPGAGLLGMRERLEGVGGSLTVAARPGRGVTLRAAVPASSRGVGSAASPDGPPVGGVRP